MPIGFAPRPSLLQGIPKGLAFRPATRLETDYGIQPFAVDPANAVLAPEPNILFGRMKASSVLVSKWFGLQFVMHRTIGVKCP